MANEIVSWKPDEIRAAAEMVVRSRLFGVRSAEEAAVLMLLAQAEGEHPARALLDYYVVNGRPALRAEAMLRRFLAAGGRVRWVTLTDEVAEAEFSHPQGGTVVIRWDLSMAQRAGLNSEPWKRYPRQMLRARVISEGIRTVYPVAGVYTPEEAQDIPPVQTPGSIPTPPQALEAPSVEVLEDEPSVSGEPEAEAEPATERQLKALWAIARERLGLGGLPREEASRRVAEFAASVLGREVGSVRELSKHEVSAVIDALQAEEGERL